MWAAKLPGEGAALADACEAMVAVMAELGVAVDGGKDSLSMAARVGTETVRAPGEAGPSGEWYGEGTFGLGWILTLFWSSLLCRVTGHLSLCCLSRYHSHCDPRPQISWRERCVQCALTLVLGLGSTS